MQNLLEDLQVLLQNDKRLVTEGKLVKNKIIELALQVDAGLIKLLLKHSSIKKHFFQNIDDVLVFDKVKFQRLISNKQFLPDSYTAFKNKIGLAINDGSTDNYIAVKNDVVLVWPHKDCVLQGGQTKEDQKRNEIFWNETLAPDNIDTLLEPKVLTGFKKYDNNGEHAVTQISNDVSLLLKGNNLICLSSISRIYRGAIKLIYIDPPYNTGSDGFDYNDSFNHSTWLTFLHNRLRLAHDLLSQDGTIAVSIDHNELGYLLVTMDEIFGIENRKNIICVKRGSVTGAKVINPGVVNISEYIVIYSKKSSYWKPNRVFKSRTRDDRYNKFIENYDEGILSWEFVSLLDKFAEYVGVGKSQLKKHLGENYEYELEKFVIANSEKVVRFAALDDKAISQLALETKRKSIKNKDKIYCIERDRKNDYYIYNGELILFVRDRLTEIDGIIQFGELVTDIWDDVLPNDLHNEGGVSLRKGKKPEKLISRLIELFTEKNDFVLDFFGGSGTTASVALKTKRKFIVIEQLDYIETLPLKRLINTINGEQSGISKSYNWQGGGDFIYVELARYNQTYIDKIQSSSDKKSLLKIWKEIEESAIISYVFDVSRFNREIEFFENAEVETIKSLLLEILDKNQLYINLSEMEDETFNVSESDKKLNRQFYKL